MAKMTIETVRVAVAQDGTVTVPDAEDMVLRDPESKKWVAAVADENGKVGRKTTPHPTRQAAFQAILAERGLVQAEQA
jgi:hypothetical protein